MFEKWRLVQITKNTEGGEAQEITAYDTEKQCMDKFWDIGSKVGGNPATAILRLMIIDPNGGLYKVDTRDNTKTR